MQSCSARRCASWPAAVARFGRTQMRRPSTMSQMPASPAPIADASGEVDAELFRTAMRELAGGVAVVTVGKDDDITGFTATSVSSLSTHPPRLAVCVAQNSASWPAIQQHRCFVVNLLRDAERSLANRFAGRDGL